MKLFLKKKNSTVDAIAEYNVDTNEFIVLKGSSVSSTISNSEKFRGARAIEKARTDKIIDNILTCDVSFKSSSTAANFVTGTSTNGMIAWKDENGNTLKNILSAMEETK